MTKARALAALCLATVAAAAQAETYVVFDVPGTVFSLQVVALNGTGAVAGSYTDAINVSHGFVRSPGGTITRFDVPGAPAGTFPAGMNANGVIAGYYWVTSFNPQGFIRAADGSVTTYNVPGSFWTQIRAINDNGDVAGTYTPNISPVAFPTGFLQSATGLATFGLSGDSLSVYAMNNLDATAGVADVQGFVRTADGTRTIFDVPKGTVGLTEVTPTGINDHGSVAGYAQQVVCGGPEGTTCIQLQGRSFVRGINGAMHVFRMPQSYKHGTYALAINSDGTTTGHYYIQDTKVAHGFIREGNGRQTPFDVPGMTHTYPTAINDSGVIAGRCVDDAGTHAFIRLP